MPSIMVGKALRFILGYFQARDLSKNQNINSKEQHILNSKR